MSVCDFQGEEAMMKQGASKRGAWALMTVCLLLLGMISITSAARRPSRPSVNVGSSPAARSAGEIVPGLAQADRDTLDLQLD
jgi:hypothetical protein